MNAHTPARLPSTRGRHGRAVALSLVLLAFGCALGSAATSIVERRASAAAASGSTAESIADPASTDEAGRAIMERLRDRLQLDDEQDAAVGAALRARLESIAAIKSELLRRVAAEHERLDGDLRRTLTDEQFDSWKQVLDEVRSNRRRRAGFRPDRGG
jgi:hypothetical protein